MKFVLYISKHMGRFAYKLMPVKANVQVVTPKESKKMQILLGDVVSTQEAAALLKLSPWTIAAWLTQGKLRRIKVGSRTFIAKSDLEKLLQDGRQ
jgi:excisionase family DNA binding protein